MEGGRGMQFQKKEEFIRTEGFIRIEGHLCGGSCVPTMVTARWQPGSSASSSPRAATSPTSPSTPGGGQRGGGFETGAAADGVRGDDVITL